MSTPLHDRSTGKLLISVTDQSLLTELFKARLPSPEFEIKAGTSNIFLINDEGQTIVFSFNSLGELVLVWAKEGREREEGRS